MCRLGLVPQAAWLKTGTYITSVVTAALGTCRGANLVTGKGCGQLSRMNKSLSAGIYKDFQQQF